MKTAITTARRNGALSSILITLAWALQAAQSQGAATYALWSYSLPLYPGNYWIYQGDAPGSDLLRQVESVSDLITCFTGRANPVGYTGTAAEVVDFYGGTWGGGDISTFATNNDSGYTVDEYCMLGGGWGEYGLDLGGGTKEYRWDTTGGLTNAFLALNNGIAVGHTATLHADAYLNGVHVGTATYTFTLLGLSTVTVPAGTYSDCLHVKFTANIPGVNLSQNEQWWAQGVGPVKLIDNGETEQLAFASFVAPPAISVAITSPKSGLVVATNPVTVSGTASGNVALAGVYCEVNDQASTRTSATSTNNWANWTASVSLSPGANTVSVYALDTSGNASPANQVTLTFNPFIAEQGTFNGLFLGTNDVTEASSGFFTLNLTTRGTFTGKIMTSASTYSLPTTATFSPAGQVQFSVPTRQNALTFNLQLDTTDPASQQITGTVSDGAWTAALTADRAVFSASTDKALDYEGQYTLAIAGSDDPAASPGGFGCATLSISSAGLIKMAGNLADGTAISQSVSVSKDGLWPFYASYAVPPAGNGGVALGWITFSNQPASDLGGTLYWFRPAGKTPIAYQGGFTNLALPVIGSRYNPANKPLLGLTSGQVILDGGNLHFATTNQITLEPNGALTVSPPNTNKLTLKITMTTGALSGSFANPSNPKQSITIKGVLLQDQTNAAGYFLGTNQSGAFLLENP